MSLGQMLAVCKTLSGIADNGGRYQMKQENLLPKFEPAKRFEPVKSEALQLPERPQPVFVPPAPARTADAQPKDANMKTVVTEKAEPEATRFPLGRWSRNPFARRADQRMERGDSLGFGVGAASHPRAQRCRRQSQVMRRLGDTVGRLITQVNLLGTHAASVFAVHAAVQAMLLPV